MLAFALTAATHRGTIGRELEVISQAARQVIDGSSILHAAATEELDAGVEAAHERPPDTSDSGDESSLMLSAWIRSRLSAVYEHFANLGWELGQHVVELLFGHVAAEHLRAASAARSGSSGSGSRARSAKRARNSSRWRSFAGCRPGSKPS
jgi:hypothetical protein